MAARHQCTMAGIPFDPRDDTDIAAYDALVIPDFSHVPDASPQTERFQRLRITVP